MTFCEEYLLYKSNQMQCSGTFDDTPSAYLKFGKLYKKKKKKEEDDEAIRERKNRLRCCNGYSAFGHGVILSVYKEIAKNEILLIIL